MKTHIERVRVGLLRGRDANARRVHADLRAKHERRRSEANGRASACSMRRVPDREAGDDWSKRVEQNMMQQRAKEQKGDSPGAR